MRASRYLHVAPWRDERHRDWWLDRALIAEAAEIEAVEAAKPKPAGTWAAG